MSAMTETEARKCWCPMARITDLDNGGAYNRWPVAGDKEGTKDTANCIASKCMAWRPIAVTASSKEAREKQAGLGYCGAFGKPSL